VIAIVDYGMGNLGSIRNMLSRIGAESIITSDPLVIEQAEKLILPGVGAFDLAMQNLNDRGLLPVLNAMVRVNRTPVLGICLGMQLMSSGSEEGARPGLGWIDARTVRLAFPDDGVRRRLPHMGWSTIRVHRPSSILDDRYEESRYYFVHSYHVRCGDPSLVLASTEYGGIEFHSAIIRDNIMGTQFHPEKSHKYGLRLLNNFVKAPSRVPL
jgi:imidazole glycerol-phosphate synthase subunit HisH